MNSNNQQQEPTKYVFSIDEDGDISPHAVKAGTAVPEIPAGVYTLVYIEPMPGRGPQLYLRPEKNFQIPERLYGDVKLNVDRYLRSYEMNDKNLGALFIGEQGSGKTMQLKALAVKAVELSYPVILINEVIPGSLLNWFLSTIVQPTLVCFDEFEKSYDTPDKQRPILQLLDGTNTGSKKMYCFSANELKKISPHMVNRPSRIRYVRTFRRLEISTVVDYVQTNLKNCTEDHVRAFIHLALADGLDEDRKNMSNGMNFDMMAEYVREMNQFPGSLNEVLHVMGLKGSDTWARFEVNGFVDGERVHHAMAHGTHSGAYAGSDEWLINFSIHVEKLREKATEDEVDRWKWDYDKVELTQRDFKSFGDSHDSLIFEKDGVEYHLRYIDFEKSNKLKIKVEETNSGKRPAQQPKTAALRVESAADSVSPCPSPLTTASSSHSASPSEECTVKPSETTSQTTTPMAEIQKTSENPTQKESSSQPPEEKNSTPTPTRNSLKTVMMTTMTTKESPKDASTGHDPDQS